MSIDRIELCGAVLSKRTKELLERELRYQFTGCLHLVDPKIVHAMAQKESYGFKTFAATRIGEIQSGTNPKDWCWVASKQNIVDQLTRGKKPNKIELNSAWQKGPDFLKLPESEWPINRVCTLQELPQAPKVIMIPNIKPKDSLAVMIDISRYLGYTGLVGLTARVLAMFRTEMRPESLSQRK